MDATSTSSAVEVAEAVDRPCCRHCGYPLDTTSDDRCPECDAPFTRSDPATWTTTRRWSVSPREFAARGFAAGLLATLLVPFGIGIWLYGVTFAGLVAAPMYRRLRPRDAGEGVESWWPEPVRVVTYAGLFASSLGGFITVVLLAPILYEPTVGRGLDARTFVIAAAAAVGSAAAGAAAGRIATLGLLLSVDVADHAARDVAERLAGIAAATLAIAVGGSAAFLIAWVPFNSLGAWTLLWMIVAGPFWIGSTIGAHRLAAAVRDAPTERPRRVFPGEAG